MKPWTLPCNGDPSHPAGCNCHYYEQYRESEQYEQDEWFDAVLRDEQRARIEAEDCIKDAYLETLS